MKVSYTLQGMMPEVFPAAGMELGDHAGEPFASHLQRLRLPHVIDWRSVLRLDVPADGVTAIGPPGSPDGIGPIDGASQRRWWRKMLNRHNHLLETSEPEASFEGDGQISVQRMLSMLFEAQQREEEIFARYVAEHED